MTVQVQNFPASFTLSPIPSPNNNGSVTLNWTSSPHATSYTILINSGSNATGLTNNSYTFTGLSDGSYNFTLQTLNSYGSINSNSMIVQVQNFPASFALSPIPSPNNNGSITLNWTLSPHATSYAIYANISLITSGLTSLSYSFNGVTDGTYNYTIVTSNAYGSDTSNIVTVIVQNYPQSFALSPVPSPNHSGSFTLSWTSSVYDASYTVYQNSSVIASELTGLSMLLVD